MKRLPTFLLVLFMACQPTATQEAEPEMPADKRIPVIFDTDANNELDDQHALAYLLFNQDIFNVKAITVNRTNNGGGLDQHMAEAERVMKLCGAFDEIPLLAGADRNYEEIVGQLGENNFDGKAAVDKIIDEARQHSPANPLVLLPVGKLTTIALATTKAPDILPNLRIVWLGSNYPEPGEYNQVNDTVSMNVLLNQDVDVEMVTVRYGKPSGTDAVRTTPDFMKEQFAGQGPLIEPSVEGRHGGRFSHFGDYSVDLFDHAELHGDPPSRALFDMAAVAIVKDPEWAEAKEIPTPILQEGKWVERPGFSRKMIIWENFDARAIIDDFVETIRSAQSI
ncbi:MAG: nucleoside hydrolase [Bacteroidota bacterium]